MLKPLLKFGVVGVFTFGVFGFVECECMLDGVVGSCVLNAWFGLLFSLLGVFEPGRVWVWPSSELILLKLGLIPDEVVGVCGLN